MFRIQTIKKGYCLLKPHKRKRIIRLSLLSIVCSLFEIVGLGSIPAFLYLLFSPDFLEKIKYIPGFIITFYQNSPAVFFVAFSVFILVVFFLKNLFATWLQNSRIKTFYSEQTRLGKVLFEKYLSAPYLITQSRNTAEYLRNLNSEILVVFNQFLIPLSNLLTDAIFIFLIFTFLLFINFWITLLATLFLFLSGLLFYTIYHEKLKHFGREEFKHRKKRHKIVTEAFNGLKEVVFYNKQNSFTEPFLLSSEKTAAAMHQKHMTAFKIRPFIETVSVFGILLITLVLVFQNKEPFEIIPLISLFAVTAIRLLPVFKQFIMNISLLRYNQPSVETIFNDLNNKMFDSDKQTVITENFNDEEKPDIFPVILNNIEFCYPERQEKVLSNISFQIQKGEIIGITGRTGSGKTTLADILAGIIKPAKGYVKAGKIDMFENKNFIAGKIAYVPQHPFILDDTIEQNIVFSSKDKSVSKPLLSYAIEKAQLKAFIESLPDGLSTSVGEKGVQVSAGQIQRIGIARAIYANPDLYVFDEATSALDVETEDNFLRYFVDTAKNKTFIFITHQVHIMKKCSRLAFLENGNIAATGSYNLLMKDSVEFNAFLSERKQL